MKKLLLMLIVLILGVNFVYGQLPYTECATDSDCTIPGEKCIKSWLYPNEWIKIITEGQFDPAREGCCKPGQCVSFDHGCMDTYSWPNNNSLCAPDLGWWMICDNSTNSIKYVKDIVYESDTATFTCTGGKWVKELKPPPGSGEVIFSCTNQDTEEKCKQGVNCVWDGKECDYVCEFWEYKQQCDEQEECVWEEDECVEKIAEDCDDGIDNDGDGAVDCVDLDCQFDKSAGADICWEASCSDGIDNDEDYTPTGIGQSVGPFTGNTGTFNIQCSYGVSTGLIVKYGDVIDSITLICSDGSNSPVGGGPGGTITKTTDCGSQYLTKLEVGTTNIGGTDYVTKIITFCNHVAKTSIQTATHVEGTSTQFGCGSALTHAFSGLSGTWVKYGSHLVLGGITGKTCGAIQAVSQQPGIDCGDSDCLRKVGPNREICCFDNSHCPEKTICSGNQCKENDCKDNIDNDQDNLTDCEDIECDQMICDDVAGEKHFCFDFQCIKKPEAEAAPSQVIVTPRIIPVYSEVLKILNSCTVRTGSSDSCEGICSADEKGFPTKKENNRVIRCTCCGSASSPLQTQVTQPTQTGTQPTNIVGGETSCTNYEDDDGDGLWDCEDPDCSADPNC